MTTCAFSSRIVVNSRTASSPPPNGLAVKLLLISARIKASTFSVVSKHLLVNKRKDDSKKFILSSFWKLPITFNNLDNIPDLAMLLAYNSSLE